MFRPSPPLHDAVIYYVLDCGWGPRATKSKYGKPDRQLYSGECHALLARADLKMYKLCGITYTFVCFMYISMKFLHTLEYCLFGIYIHVSFDNNSFFAHICLRLNYFELHFTTFLTCSSGWLDFTNIWITTSECAC